MIVPDRNFRPNARRAIYIQGLIDQQMVDRLTPKIILLQSISREPITVYIDSRGGNVGSAELVLRLLSASDQDSASPCRVITVVTSLAASAAADFLASGDYAIAYPKGKIIYHGVRQSLAEPVTVELGSFLAESLKISNDQFAMALARKAVSRFMFQFVTMKYQFDGFRRKSNSPTASDLDCFLSLISEQLSSQAREIVVRARARNEKYDALLNRALQAFKKKPVLSNQPIAQVEGAILKKIIDFELAGHKNDPTWTFASTGLTRLADDFLLLQEYISSSQSDSFRKICDRWGHFALTEAERAEVDAMADPDAQTEERFNKVRPQFQPLWSFFVALCHVLQEGENTLTALDAYYLGIIDEVIGETPRCPRLFSEFKSDEEPTPAAPPRPAPESETATT